MKSSDDPNQRYLGLTGVIMRASFAEGTFTTRLAAIKQEIFGRSDFSLHRREILDARTEPFIVLRDRTLREKFDAALLDLIETSMYRVVTVIIDKKEHRERYAVWHFQPYHYCLTVLLEEICALSKRAERCWGCHGGVAGKEGQQAALASLPILVREGNGQYLGDIFPEVAFVYGD